VQIVPLPLKVPLIRMVSAQTSAPAPISINEAASYFKVLEL